jgi:hypothetical protein
VLSGAAEKLMRGQHYFCSLRVTLAKLTLLFFIVHPGSAATFDDVRTFLIR